MRFERLLNPIFAAVAASTMTLSSGLALAQPGYGHGRHRPEFSHRHDFELAVNGFGPSQGAAGTLVTIRGRGFTPSTSVLLGNRPVALASLSANEIQFMVPGRLRDGTITLRSPNRPDVFVGTFALLSDPRITSVNTSSRRFGTRLHIHGSGFLPGDAVLLNRVSLAIVRLSPDHIVATLPDGLTSGRLMLVRPSTRQRWDAGTALSLPTPIAPSLASMSARPSPSGIEIVIMGQGFGPDARITVGSTEARILSSTPDRLVALLPMGSAANLPAIVHTRGQHLASANPVRIGFRS